MLIWLLTMIWLRESLKFKMMGAVRQKISVALVKLASPSGGLLPHWKLRMESTWTALASKTMKTLTVSDSITRDFQFWFLS
jgi:hypothetical protein